jgi:hypothetical protein
MLEQVKAWIRGRLDSPEAQFSRAELYQFITRQWPGSKVKPWDVFTEARDRLREEGLILSVQRGGRGIYQRATAEQAKHQIRRYGKKASNSIARALDTASAIPEEDLSPHGRDTLKRTTSKLEQIQGAVSAYRSSKKDFDFIPSPRPSARDN